MIGGMMFYVQEAAGAVPTRRDLGCYFPGATALRIVLPGMMEEIPVSMRRAAITTPTPGKQPEKGEADLLLQMAGDAEIDLAKSQGAVAVAILYATGDATLYRLRDGRCCEILPRQAIGLLPSIVEQWCRAG